MRDPAMRDAVLAAFEEGYVQGCYHTPGRSIPREAKRIARAFWQRVEDARRAARPSAPPARCKAPPRPERPADGSGEGQGRTEAYNANRSRP